MKKTNVLSQLALASLILWGGMSCNNEVDEPQPPFPPGERVEVIKVHINTDLLPVTTTDSTLAYIPWEKSEYLIAVPLKNKGKLLTRTSPLLPYFSLYPIEGIGTNQIQFEGNIWKNNDSLAFIRLNERLAGLHFTKIQYKTDSLPDLKLFGEILVGFCKVDTLKEMNVTLRQRTSALDIQILNKTGTDLAIRKVIMQPADKSLMPFFDRVNEYIDSFYNSYNYGRHEVTALYSEGEVKADSTFTSRLPLFLIDETILKEKEIIYTVETNQGTYSYTKTGKSYPSGIRYEENITLEER